MITSTSNAQIKNLMWLQKKAKVRREQQCFVVEGIKMVLEAPQERLKAVYMSESFSQSESAKAVLKKAEEAHIRAEIVTDKIFRDMSDTMTPQGVMAVVAFSPWDWQDMLKAEKDGYKLYLVLESLQDPGNLGTILRTSEGAGVDGVILNRTSVDPYMPKVIRSTMGSIYRMPIAVTDDLSEVIPYMKDEKFGVYAAHLKGEKNYFQQDYCRNTCFMIGNEANGLSESLAGMATDYIRIPMSGQVESLNAGVAAALLIYEVKRQREF
ncbi:MAG: RNA methyltransferase [Clostridia bacterium]|nr:RNA methyltransferase [Lachnospiraceae bacterium]NCC00020.1 RNA methyltransferase [Clostridia bacterium]NCD01864.1 RNA methyltransferase [Clostridia bacterium]